MLPNSCAWTSATGATWAAAPPSWRKKLSRSVSGSASVLITGTRLLNSGLSASIAVLSDWPRPAKASPKPSVAARALSRVSSSNSE